MNEFIARFTFQENNFSQNTYYDSIKKRKVVSFVTNRSKKISTIAEDENKSFDEIFACFDNQTLNLCQIMNWLVTNKLYSICSEDDKVKENTKSLFWNKLQSLCPVAPTNFAPKCVSASVVDAMRVVRIIPIKGTDPPLYSTWTKKLFAYIEIYLEIIYILSLIIIIVKLISSLACRKKDLKVLQKETSAT